MRERNETVSQLSSPPKVSDSLECNGVAESSTERGSWPFHNLSISDLRPLLKGATLKTWLSDNFENRPGANFQNSLKKGVRFQTVLKQNIHFQ